MEKREEEILISLAWRGVVIVCNIIVTEATLRPWNLHFYQYQQETEGQIKS